MDRLCVYTDKKTQAVCTGRIVGMMEETGSLVLVTDNMTESSPDPDKDFMIVMKR